MQKDYYASTTATVTSTAGDATLSVADPSATATGHLVNGAFSLPGAAAGQRRRSARRRATRTRRSAPPLASLLLVGRPRRPTTTVTIGFKQPIKANDALRTGSYAKTLTFTLSTTNP